MTALKIQILSYNKNVLRYDALMQLYKDIKSDDMTVIKICIKSRLSLQLLTG